MTEMLVELIQNFISGSEITLNSVFSSMLNLVFHIERELSNLKVADGSFIDFNAIYQTIFNYNNSNLNEQDSCGYPINLDIKPQTIPYIKK